MLVDRGNGDGASGRRLVPAVDRAVRVLWLLAGEPAGLTLTEVAAALCLTKSSAHDLLGTLVFHGMVDRHWPTRRYRLGLRLAELAHLAGQQTDVTRSVHGLVADLGAATGATVLLCAWSGDGFVVVDRAMATGDLRLTAPLGKTLHPLTGAFAKVLVAFGDREAATVAVGRALLARPRPWTDLDRLWAETPAVREAGVATDDGEYLPGVWGVSAPVMAAGELVGALTVVGLGATPAGPQIATAAPAVRRTAARISHLLDGWSLTSLGFLAPADGT